MHVCPPRTHVCPSRTDLVVLSRTLAEWTTRNCLSSHVRHERGGLKAGLSGVRLAYIPAIWSCIYDSFAAKHLCTRWCVYPRMVPSSTRRQEARLQGGGGRDGMGCKFDSSDPRSLAFFPFFSVSFSFFGALTLWNLAGAGRRRERGPSHQLGAVLPGLRDGARLHRRCIFPRLAELLPQGLPRKTRHDLPGSCPPLPYNHTIVLLQFLVASP